MKIRLEEESKLFPEWETKKTTYFLFFVASRIQLLIYGLGKVLYFFAGKVS